MNLSRRGFLGGSLASTAALAVTAPARAALAAPILAPVVTSTVLAGGSVWPSINAAVLAGFKFIQVKGSAHREPPAHYAWHCLHIHTECPLMLAPDDDSFIVENYFSTDIDFWDRHRNGVISFEIKS